MQEVAHQHAPEGGEVVVVEGDAETPVDIDHVESHEYPIA
jgi:hypothetical protein